MNHRLFAILLISSTLCATGARQASAAENNETSTVFSRVPNPQVPKNVHFCGKSVSLDRADMFERFDRELTSMIYTHGNTLLTIKRANRYFPQIAPVLKANGMPEDLLYLACIESSLNPRAMSPAKAAGIWQFMPSTAKEYGLEVTDEVDERYNIEKSTAAAVKYFRKALERYNGNWPSAMASYNTGMGRVSTQLEAQLANDAFDLYLADETMRYPFRVMAMKTIMESPAKYGFIIDADQLYQPRECRIVEVSGPVESWAEWAKQQGTTYQALRDENPWIRSLKLTNKAGKTYKVRVPDPKSLKRSTQARRVFNPNWTKK